MQTESNSAAREKNADLRGRCGQLRQYSRDLRYRSQECRIRVSRAADGVANAATSFASGRETDDAGHLARLMRAESDLQCAISECTVALDEVRRELLRQDVMPSTPAVH